MALDYGPDPVPTNEPAPNPIGVPTPPPPSGAQIGAFVMPTAPRATTMNTSTRFIEIDYNGNIVTSAVTNMDFTGPGVIVSNVGSAVTINIPGSNGTPTGPNNSVQFNSDGTLVGDSRLIFDPATSILTVTGNIAAGFFVGDGTRLRNITGSNVVGLVANAQYANLSSTVTSANQPNITSVGSLTSLNVTGNISTAANITGNYFIGNGALLTGISVPNAYGNSNVVTLLNNYGSNSISTTGNVRAGQLSTTGNVTGTYFFGNGSQLAGLPQNYTNANVVTLLAGFGSNTISTTGNVTSGNINTAGNVTGGNLLTTGRISTVGDIIAGNVNAGASIVATAHTGSTFSASGNVTGGNLNTAGLVVATGNVSGGNLRTVGQVSATGNVSGSYFIGNGALLTGIVANTTYGNSNVVTLLAGFGSNTISTTGNVTGGNIIGNVVASGAGTPTVASTGNLDLSAVTAVRVIGGGTFRLPTFTTAQIANLTAVNGDMVYNSTTAKIQAYAGNVWGNITLS